MKDIYLRTKQLAQFVVATKSTVRKAAQVFGISKSTVHYDLTRRLLHFDTALYLKVKMVLEKNLNERSMRGGLATKVKYRLLKNK
ncbi:MAG TPA: stage III sporulation protein D [Clostridiales bacterium]|nr:stage III sporulation protein D [Clostridiales bacterium]